MGSIMTIVNVVGGMAIAISFFLGYSDRSWSAALQWALFYTAGIGIPALWSRRTARALNELGVPLSRELRLAPFYPPLAGLITTATAIGLIRSAWLH